MFDRSRRFLVTPILALAALGAASQADAASYTLGGGSSVDGLNADPGLVIHTDVHDLDSVSFSLNDGESYTFDFFDIWTDETSVNKDDPTDDTMSYDISAFLDFDTPSELVQVNGETVGDVEWGWFIVPYTIHKGILTWDGPVVVDHAGGQFQVSLSDEIFNWGVYGLHQGECYGATVQATVTQISSQVVPTPSAAAAGLMLAGLGLLRRRRLA